MTMSPSADEEERDVCNPDGETLGAAGTSVLTVVPAVAEKSSGHVLPKA